MSTKRTLAERAEQIRTILGDPLYRYQQTVSTDAPASDDDPDGATLGDLQRCTKPNQEEVALAAERRVLLARRMRTLTPREQAVVGLRFADWTLSEVGLALGLSREGVRKIEVEAHARIGVPADAPAPDSYPALAELSPGELRRRQLDLVEELGEAALSPADRLACQREAEAVRLALVLAEERQRTRASRLRRSEYLRIQLRRGDLLTTVRERLARELGDLTRALLADRGGLTPVAGERRNAPEKAGPGDALTPPGP